MSARCQHARVRLHRRVGRSVVSRERTFDRRSIWHRTRVSGSPLVARRRPVIGVPTSNYSNNPIGPDRRARLRHVRTGSPPVSRFSSSVGERPRVGFFVFLNVDWPYRVPLPARMRESIYIIRHLDVNAFSHFRTGTVVGTCLRVYVRARFIRSVYYVLRLFYKQNDSFIVIKCIFSVDSGAFFFYLDISNFHQKSIVFVYVIKFWFLLCTTVIFTLIL